MGLWGFHVFGGMNWIKIQKCQLSYSKCLREFSRGFHWWQEKWPWNRTWRCWRDLGKSCTSWKFIESGNDKYFNVNRVQFIFMILLDDLPVDCSWFILPSLLAGGVYCTPWNVTRVKCDKMAIFSNESKVILWAQATWESMLVSQAG